MLQRSRCTKGSVRASWSARCTHQCNSSWQLCSTNACWNKGGNLWDIREGAKEFTHLPLPLLTALKQIFSESETTESRCFVLPRCWELFALFPRQLKKLLYRLEDFLFEWSLFIHTRWELVQGEISARDISLCEWKIIITMMKVWKFTLQFKAPTQI